MDDDFDEFGNFVGQEYSDSDASSVVNLDDEVAVVENDFDEQSASRPLVQRRETRPTFTVPRPVNYAFQQGLQKTSGLQRFVTIKGETNHGKTALFNWLAPALATDLWSEPRQLTMQPKFGCCVHQLGSGKSVMLNLADTPGHEDFGTERLLCDKVCDGAVLVVDCVEGTRNSRELGPYNLVVLTKFDRLMLELKLPAQLAFERLNFLITEELNTTWDAVVITSAKFGFSFSVKSVARLYQKYRQAKVNVESNIAEYVINPIFKLIGFALIGEACQPQLLAIGICLSKDEWKREADERIKLVMQLYLEKPFLSLVDAVFASVPNPEICASELQKPTEYVGLLGGLWWGRNDGCLLNIDCYVLCDKGLVAAASCEPYAWFCTENVAGGIPVADYEAEIDHLRLLYVALEPLKPGAEVSSELESQLRQLTNEWRGCKVNTFESGEFVLTAPGEMYIDHFLNQIDGVAYRVSQPIAVLQECVSTESQFSFPTRSADHKFSVSISAEPNQENDDIMAEDVTSVRWAELSRDCCVYGPECDEATKERILEGIESCCDCGPLIEAPLTAVKFTVADIEAGPTFQIASTARRAAYSAILLAEPRLREPEMRVSVVGKLIAGKAVYSQLEKRVGQVVVDTPIYGTNLYMTEAEMPLMDSLAFAFDVLCHVDQRNDATVRSRFSKWIEVTGDPLDSTCVTQRAQAAEPAGRARDFMIKIRRRRNLAPEPDLGKYVDPRVLQAIQNHSQSNM